MRVPDGYTEQQVVDTISSIVNQLAGNFRFGYFDLEELKQHGFLEAIEALNKGAFDSTRYSKSGNALYNFLFSHLRNRYMNFKRDHFERYEIPCKLCPFFDPKCKKSTNKCAAFEDKLECPKWASFMTRNQAKKSLAMGADLSEVGEYLFKSLHDYSGEMSNKELKADIDAALPMNLRADYLRLIQGVNVGKKTKALIQEALQGVFEKYGLL